MRPIIAVDLATKFSAGIVLDQHGDFVSQWDSYGWKHSQVAQQIFTDYTALRDAYIDAPPLVVIEDVPPRNLPNLRGVLQLQGRILQVFGKYGDDLYWVPPALWQHEMGVFGATDGETAKRAAEFGYEPPDLVEMRGLKRGERGYGTAIREADKQATDYVDAFLIAMWARWTMERNQVWDLRVVRQYGV